MKGVIGFLFFMLFLAGFAFVMLLGRETEPTHATPPVESLAIEETPKFAFQLGANWKPRRIGGEAVPSDTTMFVQILPDGEINGYAGCNSFFGSIEETDRGFRIGPLGATRKACEEEIMDREKALLDAMEAVRGFSAGDSTLDMLDENGDVLISLAVDSAP